VTDGCVRRVVLGSDEFHVLIFEAKVIDRFLDQVGVLVSTVRNSAVGRGRTTLRCLHDCSG